MMTLLELRDLVETAPLTDDKEAPGWRQLRKYGGEIVAKADFSGNHIMEVFENGYVYYRTDRRWTTFSLQDTTLSFEIDDQDDYYLIIKKREILKYSIYDEMPWFVRVMFEGEIRINTNRYKEDENNTSFDTTFDDYGLFGYISENPLDVVLRKERDEEMYRRFVTITERQQYAITECILKGKTKTEVGRGIGKSHQSVSDAIKKGRIKLRKIYDEVYGAEE